MYERATTSVPATLCKRCGVLRHTSDHDSHIGLAAATALPLGVLSVFLREFPGNWRLAPILIYEKHVKHLCLV